MCLPGETYRALGSNTTSVWAEGVMIQSQLWADFDLVSIAITGTDLSVKVQSANIDV